MREVLMSFPVGFVYQCWKLKSKPLKRPLKVWGVFASSLRNKTVKKQLCYDFIVFFDNNTSRIRSFFLLSSLDVNQNASRSKTVGNLGLLNKFSFDCSLGRTNNSGTVAPKLNQWTLLADWAKWWVSRICGWAISILTRWSEWINRSCNTPPSAYFWTMHNH